MSGNLRASMPPIFAVVMVDQTSGVPLASVLMTSAEERACEIHAASMPDVSGVTYLVQEYEAGRVGYDVRKALRDARREARRAPA